MKKIQLSALLFLCWAGSFTMAHAQLSDNFNKELKVIIQASVSALRGNAIESQSNGVKIYSVKPKLTGFELTYTETSLGHELRARYIGSGSEQVMDAIAERFLELPYVALDSKKDKKILGPAILSGNLQRKIKLTDLSGNWFVSAELYNDHTLLLLFNK